ncbi:MAG TPA: hypothetical protein VLT17_14200 [Gemmatimonadales bacterium]|nr:hypothetical protein [Gemmatimonadales bacterium]
MALISGCTGDPGGVDVVTPGPGRPGRIAFVSTRNGNAEIYVMNADGSGQVNLTNRRGGDNSPAWRPR